MVIENTGTVTGGGGTERLREALEGKPVRQVQEQPETPPRKMEQGDQVTLSNQLEVAMRSTNDRMARVQERTIANQETLQGLNAIQDQLKNFSTTFQANNQNNQDNPDVNREDNTLRDTQPRPDVRRNTPVVNREAVNQTIENIDRIAQNTEFKGQKLLEDYSAKELGLTRMADEGQKVEVEQVVSEAQVKVQDRQDEVKQEQSVDRQEMQTLQVSMENIAAARSTERVNETRKQDIERAVETIRQEGTRGGGEMHLTPDRVLELI